ncbi:hypothetical protein AK812_SmicGene25567 [Symbiodinium microadriaticum]|uniref:Uncharacterized protein n=1 Tax=Symbiodinium microadriaticum TaxID=2951 RepID=A0A1Q9DBT9_SYMMI|nr:hypothetical protein AK812_SmicGene25567 [Symbiodinium microadriaticum]
MRAPLLPFLSASVAVGAELQWLWGTQVLAKEHPQAASVNAALVAYLRNLSAHERPEIRSNRNGAWQSRRPKVHPMKMVGPKYRESYDVGVASTSAMPAYVPPHRRTAAADNDLDNSKEEEPSKNLFVNTAKNGHKERWANIDDDVEHESPQKGVNNWNASPEKGGGTAKQPYRPPGARTRGDGDNVNFIRDIMNDFETNGQGWGNAAPALTGKEVGGHHTDLTEAQVRGDGEVPQPFTTTRKTIRAQVLALPRLIG